MLSGKGPVSCNAFISRRCCLDSASENTPSRWRCSGQAATAGSSRHSCDDVLVTSNRPLPLWRACVRPALAAAPSCAPAAAAAAADCRGTRSAGGAAKNQSISPATPACASSSTISQSALAAATSAVLLLLRNHARSRASTASSPPSPPAKTPGSCAAHSRSMSCRNSPSVLAVTHATTSGTPWVVTATTLQPPPPPLPPTPPPPPSSLAAAAAPSPPPSARRRRSRCTTTPASVSLPVPCWPWTSTRAPRCSSK